MSYLELLKELFRGCLGLIRAIVKSGVRQVAHAAALSSISSSVNACRILQSSSDANSGYNSGLNDHFALELGGEFMASHRRSPIANYKTPFVLDIMLLIVGNI